MYVSLSFVYDTVHYQYHCQHGPHCSVSVGLLFDHFLSTCLMIVLNIGFLRRWF
jgi:hypothetical protein